MFLAALMAGVMSLGEVCGQGLANVWGHRDTPTGLLDIPEEAVAMEYWEDSQALPNESRVLFVTGWGLHPLTQQPFIATYKYNVDGEDQEARRLAGPVFFPPLSTALASKPAAIVVHPTTGDVYIVGYSTNPGQGRTDTDYIILKYDRNLNPHASWQPQPPYNLFGVRHYDGMDHGDDRAVDVTIATGGGEDRLFVTGTSWDQTTGNDIVTLRLNPGTGDQVWEHRYDFNGGPDEATRIVWTLITTPESEPGAHPVVAGTSHGGLTTGTDYVALIYKGSNGQLFEEVWPGQGGPGTGGWRRWNGPGGGNDICTWMEGQPADSRYQVHGLIALCGSVTPLPTGPATDTDFGVWGIVLHNGLTAFATTWDGGDKKISDDVATGVAVSDQGVWVTGSARNGDAYDIATLLISTHPSSPGTILGHHIFGEPGLDDERATAIFQATGTSAYVAGWSYNASGNYYSYVVLKYSFPSPSGLLAATWWEGGWPQRSRAIRVNPDGQVGGVYVTGGAGWAGYSLDYFTIRLTP